MKKITVLLFSAGLLSISLYAMSNNSFYIQIIMNLSTPFIYARIALVTILLTYAFVPSLRIHTTRALLSVSGILLLSLGLISIGSPTILGKTNNYMLLGDSLTLIEGGILAVVLSAELSARRSRFVVRSFIYIRTLFATQPRKLVYSPPVLSAKILKSQLQLKPLLSVDRSLPMFEGLIIASTALNKAPT